MDRTLADKDRLIISDIGYTPERGDIVVIHDPDATVNGERVFRGPIIKRVIATAGETVILDYDNWTIEVIDVNGKVFVLEETYVNFPAYDVGDNIGIPRETSDGTYIFVCTTRPRLSRTASGWGPCVHMSKWKTAKNIRFGSRTRLCIPMRSVTLFRTPSPKAMCLSAAIIAPIPLTAGMSAISIHARF